MADTFQGLAVNEFRDATFECPDSASAANGTQPVCLDGNQVGTHTDCLLATASHRAVIYT